MSEKSIRVLLVEDNPGDAKLFSTMLTSVGGNAFSLVHAKRLDEALKLCGNEDFDVLVLDLGLPDSQGMETVDIAREQDNDKPLPIVVITGVMDESEGLVAMRHGAQDFLVKDHMRADVVARTLHYAVERQRQLNSIEEINASRREEEELSSLETLASPATSQFTARAFGQERLKEASPDTFEVFVEQYTALVTEALDERVFKVDHRISQGIRVMAQRLGFLRASPRDVVEVHTEAIKGVLRDAKTRQRVAVIEEGRLLLIQMMGYVAAYYRDHMIPTVRPRPDRQTGLENQ